MAIKVLRNDAGNCVNFSGSSNPAYWNACLSASIDLEDSTRINIINNVRTVVEDTIVYEFYKVRFDDFADSDGNVFTSAQEAVDFINAACNVLADTGTFVFSDTDTVDFVLNASNTGILADTGDAFILEEVRAVETPEGKINIVRQGSEKVIYQDITHTNLSIGGTLQSGTVTEAVNALNALLLNQGSSFSVPDLSGLPSTVDVITGETFNFFTNIDSSNPVATEFEWSGLVAGEMFVGSGSRGQLTGNLSTAGSYPVTVYAWNSFGVASKTITFVATAASAFDNTLSYRADTGYHLDTPTDNAAIKTALQGETPWSISWWVKPGTNGNKTQNMIVFGNAAVADSRVNLYFAGNQERLHVRVGGATDNYVDYRTGANALTEGVWNHVLLCYDGTGTAVSDFNLFIDGVLTPMSQNDLSGTPFMPADVENLRVGRCLFDNSPLRSGLMDEVAIWNSDQSANAATIYNLGATQDLSALGTAPSHWYRMGDGQTFPTVDDQIGSADMTLFNGTNAVFVADAVQP